MSYIRSLPDSPDWWRRLEQVHGRVAFDVGANGGQVTRMFAEHFDRVYAFEPALESFRELERTAPENVTPMAVAVSDHDGEVALREADRSIRTGQLVTGDLLGWGSTVGERIVPCRTLDSIVAETGATPDVVKVDVEGHELLVMSGARDLISTGPLWLIEIHHVSLYVPIRRLLGSGYHVEHVAHTGYRAESYGATNHFYVKATPTSNSGPDMSIDLENLLTSGRDHA